MPVYTVERLVWRAVRYLDEKFETDWEGFVQLPGARRLRSFDTAEEADAFCKEQEAAIRAKVNPFACGGPALHYQSRFDDGRLRDWLLDAGLEPPAPGAWYDTPGTTSHWRAWYDEAAPRMTPAQLDALWQALDRVRFYRVTERPPAKTAYVVTRREWDYNDNWYYTTSADGRSIEAYSTYEKAEAARQRWERNERNTWGESSLEVNNILWSRLQPGDTLLPRRGGDVFAEDGDDRLFFEVVEVEVG
jgi:hypothetical protein